MVLGAKLRTVMSSIIRWRNGEILRAVAMAQRNEVMSLMASNNNPIRAGFGDRQFWLTWRAHARRRSGNPSPAKRVSTMVDNARWLGAVSQPSRIARDSEHRVGSHFKAPQRAAAAFRRTHSSSSIRPSGPMVILRCQQSPCSGHNLRIRNKELSSKLSSGSQWQHTSKQGLRVSRLGSTATLLQ